MINKSIFFMSIFYLLIGCSKKYDISPDILPLAYVDQNYKQEIIISGGRVIGNSLKISNDFPNNINMKIEPINDDRPDIYNFLEITGTPKYKGNYTIKISAQFYGGGDKEVTKLYKFIIK